MIKFVEAEDWLVLYGVNGEKIWEGHYTNSNSIVAVAKYFGIKVEHYRFTNEDEIDGITPDNFYSIKEIEKI